MSFDFSQLFVFDAAVVASVIIASLIFFYSVGKYAIVPMIAAQGIGGVFAALAPYVGNVPGMSSWPAYQQHVFVFAIATAIAFFIFRRHSYFEPSDLPNVFERIVCGVVIAGFVLAVIGSFLPVDILSSISPQIRFIFTDPVQRTLWLIGPVVMLGIMRRR